ncbi:DUF2975 domain-containing protein [Deinococcus yavapaiensis]|uniref:Uncharacterized protein n=1 Tax=Deinococcus yavapaiensis KR-236 TaxID=694435 RepID=A0A318S2G1_9DEIO|nr:DUF2975 domain-containing protein [Deinococcus yavapaiensis]PYE49481.1 hypothetical protein DES52_12227 [Deinococcus yavapaiensis KR-236]
MLSTEAARTVLKLFLTLGLIIISLSLIASLIFAGRSLLNDSEPIHLSWGVPIDMSLGVQQQTFRISEVRVNYTATPWMYTTFVLLGAATLGVLFLVYRRALRFVHRLLDDPFAEANRADLQAAARLALAWQGVLLITKSVMWWTTSQQERQNGPLWVPLYEAVRGVEGVTFISEDVRFNIDPWSLLNQLLGVDFTPLLVAAGLTILATVFKRAHDVREQERQLRREQELTI